MALEGSLRFFFDILAFTSVMVLIVLGLELFLEDTASDPKVAIGNVRKLIQEHKVDVVLGGITSAMRQAIKDPIVNRGRTCTSTPPPARLGLAGCRGRQRAVDRGHVALRGPSQEVKDDLRLLRYLSP